MVDKNDTYLLIEKILPTPFKYLYGNFAKKNLKFEINCKSIP